MKIYFCVYFERDLHILVDSVLTKPKQFHKFEIRVNGVCQFP